MAKNEMVVLTQDAINALSNKELKREINSYYTAGNSINNSRWLMAEAIYNVVNDDLFDEDFETEQEFFNFINIKKSNASQLINAVGFMKREQFDYSELTVKKAYTLSTLTEEEFTSFCIYCMNSDIIYGVMSDSAFVELVKEWKMAQLNEIEEEAEEQETEGEEQEVETDERAGIIAQIKEYMAKYNITIEELA